MPPLNTFSKTCVAVAVSQLLALPAQAAFINVNSELDDNGAGCTLREAVVSMNTESALSGCANLTPSQPFGTNDLITINIRGDQTITLTAGQLSIAAGKDIILEGRGNTVDAGGANRAFLLNASTLNASRLTIFGGSAIAGGAVYVSDGSNLNLTHSELSGNSATASSGVPRGGGAIYAASGSVVTLTNTSIVNNFSASFGGGIRVDGNSIVSLDKSVVSSNIASSRGGGIYSIGSGGSLSLLNSTVSDNSANSNGGGITHNGNAFSMTNSTVSGNSSGGTGGGLIAVTAISNMVHSTIFGNTAATGGGLFTQSGNFTLSNTIIAGNVANSGAEIGRGSATFTTTGMNVIGDDSHTSAQAFISFTPDASDITATSDGTNPTLLSDIISPLADNGGNTLSHALPAGSPALEVADGAICIAAPTSSLDQRGLFRNSTCDIGAFEQQKVAVITVNSASGGAGINVSECTLRDAITASNSDTAVNGCIAGDQAEEIVFGAGVATTVTLTSALPTITSNLSITGPALTGQTIDASVAAINTPTRVLTIDSATVELSNLTMTGGIEYFAGGIYSGTSDLTIRNSTVSGNSVTGEDVGGAGIYAREGKLSLLSSTISSNSADGYGGGIYAYNNKLSLVNSTLSGNSASKGGAIYVSASTTDITNTTITDNMAGGEGGGVFFYDGKASINNSLIAGNSGTAGSAIANGRSRSDITTSGINLFGDSSRSNNDALYSVVSSAPNISATSDGTSPTPIISIVEPLANNGGLTQTHALPASSPANNAAESSVCANTPVNEVDQRGEPRSSSCDIGAFELANDVNFFVVPLPNGKSVIFNL